MGRGRPEQQLCFKLNSYHFWKEIRRQQCTAQCELYTGKGRRKSEEGVLDLGPRGSSSRLKNKAENGFPHEKK
jgi:hypothetical protein